jgi:hypothetical protein
MSNNSDDDNRVATWIGFFCLFLFIWWAFQSPRNFCIAVGICVGLYVIGDIENAKPQNQPCYSNINDSYSTRCRDKEYSADQLAIFKKNYNNYWASPAGRDSTAHYNPYTDYSAIPSSKSSSYSSSTASSSNANSSAAHQGCYTMSDGYKIFCSDGSQGYFK